MPQPYNLNNDPEVVSGRRIARFFGVEDPNSYGSAQLIRAQVAVRQLPELISKRVLSIDWSMTTSLSPEETLPVRSNALAEWLCGMQTRKAAELADMPEGGFGNFIYSEAEVSIGSPEFYDLLFAEQEKPAGSI